MYKPYTVQIELVQGCNRKCSFCGCRGFENNPLCYIDKLVLRRQCELITASGYNPRILIAGHGEPMLHPHFISCIKIMRKYMPQAHLKILTNGTQIKKDATLLVKMFEAGINDVNIDEYSNSKFDIDRVRSIMSKNGLDNIPVEVMIKGTPFYLPKRNDNKRVLITPAIEEGEVSLSRKLSNHCGAGMPPTAKYKKRKCTRIFRELSFRWDGSVCICCQDFRGEYYVGNVMDNVQHLDELWLHERMEAARRILYHKGRVFFPCNICDALPLREGLLPDAQGKEKMPLAKKSDLDIVNKRYKPLTKIVKREWENA